VWPDRLGDCRRRTGGRHPRLLFGGSRDLGWSAVGDFGDRVVQRSAQIGLHARNAPGLPTQRPRRAVTPARELRGVQMVGAHERGHVMGGAARGKTRGGEERVIAGITAVLADERTRAGFAVDIRPGGAHRPVRSAGVGMWVAQLEDRIVVGGLGEIDQPAG
jgi:hypothetical protein